MNGIVLGVAMLVSAAGVSPVPEPSRAIIVSSAFTFELPERAATSHLSDRLLHEQRRPAWRREAHAQATTANRCSRATRIIAIVAGGFGGWMAGGIIGGYAAARPNDDGANLMRGVMIGAPIGAAVGAVVAYRLTK